MIKGIYSSEAAMRPKMARMEVLANNLANINTTGFKQDRVFVRMLKESSTPAADGRSDLTGVDTQKYIDLSAGTLRQTGNPFDLALSGEGFFAVDTPGGVRLTRNGNFSLSAEGTLVTAEGHPVLGTAGQIRLPNMDRLRQDSIAVNTEGEVVCGKETLGQLRIMVAENPAALQKDHESLLFVNDGERLRDVNPGAATVQQGFLEDSNVDGIEEMIAMIELSRAFETDQRMIQSQDATLDRSMEIGRL
jgi:flagellar basal-body rod protein FlgG